MAYGNHLRNICVFDMLRNYWDHSSAALPKKKDPAISIGTCFSKPWDGHWRTLFFRQMHRVMKIPNEMFKIFQDCTLRESWDLTLIVSRCGQPWQDKTTGAQVAISEEITQHWVRLLNIEFWETYDFLNVFSTMTLLSQKQWYWKAPSLKHAFDAIKAKLHCAAD